MEKLTHKEAIEEIQLVIDRVEEDVIPDPTPPTTGQWVQDNSSSIRFDKNYQKFTFEKPNTKKLTIDLADAKLGNTCQIYATGVFEVINAEGLRPINLEMYDKEAVNLIILEYKSDTDIVLVVINDSPLSEKETKNIQETTYTIKREDYLTNLHFYKGCSIDLGNLKPNTKYSGRALGGELVFQNVKTVEGRQSRVSKFGEFNIENIQGVGNILSGDLQVQGNNNPDPDPDPIPDPDPVPDPDPIPNPDERPFNIKHDEFIQIDVKPGGGNTSFVLNYTDSIEEGDMLIVYIGIDGTDDKIREVKDLNNGKYNRVGSESSSYNAFSNYIYICDNPTPTEDKVIDITYEKGIGVMAAYIMVIEGVESYYGFNSKPVPSNGKLSLPFTTNEDGDIVLFMATNVNDANNFTNKSFGDGQIIISTKSSSVTGGVAFASTYDEVPEEGIITQEVTMTSKTSPIIGIGMGICLKKTIKVGDDIDPNPDPVPDPDPIPDPPIELEVPQYAMDAIQEAKNEAERVDPENKFLKFIYITDSHNSNLPNPIPTRGNNLNSDKSAVILSQTGLYDAFIHGGDIHDANKCSKSEAMKRIATMKSLYNMVGTDKYFVRGNHDANMRNTENPLSHQITSEEFFNTFNNNEHEKVVDPKHPNRGWFYRDYDDYNIRMIFVNNCDSETSEFGRSPEQDEWIDKVALRTDKHVLVFLHNFAPGQSIQTPLKFFIRERNGVVALVMGGHLHQDRTWENPYKFKTTLSQASLNKLDQEGTIDEICFESVVVDTDNKKVHIHRVGRGESRVIDYSFD